MSGWKFADYDICLASSLVLQYDIVHFDQFSEISGLSLSFSEALINGNVSIAVRV